MIRKQKQMVDPSHELCCFFDRAMSRNYRARVPFWAKRAASKRRCLRWIARPVAVAATTADRGELLLLLLLVVSKEPAMILGQGCSNQATTQY
jgi:hypothetical protein